MVDHLTVVLPYLENGFTEFVKEVQALVVLYIHGPIFKTSYKRWFINHYFHLIQFLKLFWTLGVRSMRLLDL